MQQNWKLKQIDVTVQAYNKPLSSTEMHEQQQRSSKQQYVNEVSIKFYTNKLRSNFYLSHPTIINKMKINVIQFPKPNSNCAWCDNCAWCELKYHLFPFFLFLRQSLTIWTHRDLPASESTMLGLKGVRHHSRPRICFVSQNKLRGTTNKVKS